MRVIAGQFGGRKLLGPRGRRIRPTSDRVRESLFAILGERVIGARFADLCAGTGSVGFEALSRGAWHTTFVEKSHAAVTLLRKNIKTLNLSPDQVDVWNTDVIRLSKPVEPWNIVFIDPPYNLAERIVSRLVGRNILGHETLVIVEHAGKEPVSVDESKLWVFDHRTYGQTSLTFLRTP